ncbi:MAG: cytosolic protein [Desulfobacteraceae bacterium]|nr:MAG: cytosolic protein [Desulfobacteraceae bacterium]
MDTIPNGLDEVRQPEKTKHLLDMFQRIMVHYALWFSEVRNRMGVEKAMEILNDATRRSFAIQMKRFVTAFGGDMQETLPAELLGMPENRMDELMKNTAVNWLANDGVWFQAVEFSSSMKEAKACNDAAWQYFSPFEATAIKGLLGLSENPGLDGLKKALNFRLYACINTQSFVEEGSNSFVFQMNECRVQVARKRKNLDDYPCKSGGMIEYTTFARTIDGRIRTECVGCPPDQHPKEWYCAWRFSI